MEERDVKVAGQGKLEGEIARLGKQPLNGDRSMINGAVTLGWFVTHRYLPLKEADWRAETAKVKKHLIQADLVMSSGRYASRTSISSHCRSISTSWRRHVRKTECCRFEPI
jgi:hypothetical protein